MRPCIFIHTNHKQYLGAIVSQHSFKRYSDHADEFDVRIIHTKDYPFLQAHEGEEYLRDGVTRNWRYDDLQSFTTLRFMPPEIMNYEGRSVVVDPDVFAVGDVWPLLTRDMQGKAIITRPRKGAMSIASGGDWNSSVMLMENAKLTHWKVQEQFESMFRMERDYRKWVTLGYEDQGTIGELEPIWNDLDRLTPETRMVHNTRRMTQPWKSGLPVDFIPAERFRFFPPVAWVMRARRKLFGDYGLLGKYKSHPDQNQQNLFFGLLRECLENGMVSEETIKAEMEQNHVRHDAFEVMKATPPLASVVPTKQAA
ncbi:hypothetical protein [Marinivivus vitaminiproducens]|uniref:hypothetical protein n=1 Tax=Marinivivus vitaminiproducens TaxID=3035935 RepID=UPI00279E9FE4|nr:hypothetical protein P4R82_13235 [Geminicoccaceae bacterium SCSIO 64248]